MTPEQFLEKMREIYSPEKVDNPGGYEVQTHIGADELMCEVLRSLGYGEGVAIFEKASKWYE